MDYKKRYEMELSNEKFDADYKKKLREISEEEKKDSFYTSLEFGTAGIRGKVGVGPNRLNKYNITKVSYALAKYLNEVDKNPTAVIAFDSRRDSAFFAKQTAITLASNGVKTFLFDTYTSTPELSFAIRHLKCTGGVVITASHNPPEYSGFKTYHSSGRQVLDDEAGRITEIYDSVEDVFAIEVGEFNVLLEEGKIEMVGEEVFSEFYNAVVKGVDTKEVEDFNVVYTPLHGVGFRPMKSAMEKIGVKNFFVVSAQKDPDGDFPTEKTPNPENPLVYKLALELAKEKNADIIIASDPDADRLGSMVKHNGEYIFISGNEMGIILLDHIMKKSDLSKKSFAVSTIVSTKMISKMAEVHNFEVPRTLTGFKHICNAMNDYLDKGYQYLLGFEESFGYLVKEHIRDKDSISAAVCLVDIARGAKANGKTIIDLLDEAYQKYGYYKEAQIVFKLEGIEGKEKIKEIISKLREIEINEMVGKKLIKRIDFLNEETGLPKQNAIRWDYEDDYWFAIRPSGTEPKLKIYYGVKEDSREKSEEMIKKFGEKIEEYLR